MVSFLFIPSLSTVNYFKISDIEPIIYERDTNKKALPPHNVNKTPTS